MGLTYQNILGIRITTSSKEKILEDLKKWLDQTRESRKENGKKRAIPFIIVTPNPEQIVLAQRNNSFKEILNQADVTLPDGIGIVFASQFLQQGTGGSKSATVRERIPGVEFMGYLVSLAAEQRVRIGLIGGQPGLAVKALECLRETNPKLEGWADEGPELVIGKDGDIEGPGDAYWVSLVKRIVSTKTNILFVGLGAPKQEYVISRIARALSLRGQPKQSEQDYYTQSARDDKGIILMSVGGSFDMITGRLKRAPLFIRSIGFEWVWRLAVEPWRWKRQLALLQFIFLVGKERFRK